MEASEAIDPMEGICLFLWSDASYEAEQIVALSSL